MRTSTWFWLGTALNLIVLAPALYMAIETVDLVAQSDRSPASIGVGVLFCALPLFCVATPLAAWRAKKRGRSSAHVVMELSLPLIYAAFLVLFLMKGAP